MPKTAVLFVFHIFDDRVKQFFANAIFKDENVDFIVICNTFDIEITHIQQHVPNYVKILQRNNIGYDFGGWTDALHIDTMYKNYENFIFVNSSVSGPFLVPYFKGNWTDVYIQGLKDNVKLFGSTINCIDEPKVKSHVQSYIFAMNLETLEYLRNCHIFSQNHYAQSFHSAILDKEVAMSRKIIEKGWNIGCLLPLFQDVDFTFQTKDVHEYECFQKTEYLNDIMFPPFRNTLWNEYQLVFIKGNRVRGTEGSPMTPPLGALPPQCF